MVEDLAAKFEKYYWNPVRFVHEMFHVEPKPYQAKFLTDLVYHRQNAIRSGHGCGKTAVLAWGAIWFFLTRANSKIPWTAPTFDRQVKNIGFAELTKWIKRIPEIEAIVDLQTTKIGMRGTQDQWFILGVSAGKAANIEGFHAPHVLYIFDEAKGIRREIFEAAAGALTQNGNIAVGSVPGGPHGYFYDCFNAVANLWSGRHVSAYDSDLVSDEWIEGRKREWGENSPVFITRVLGDFPQEGEDTLIPLNLIEEAIVRWHQQVEDESYRPSGIVRVGADIARFGGDETVVTKVQGTRVLSTAIRRYISTEQAEGMILSSARSGPKADSIAIDSTGLGAGPADHVKTEMGEIKVDQVEYAGRPLTADGQRDYLNRKAELYFALAEGFREGEISIPDDPVLLAQLSSLRYDFTPKGQRKIRPYEPPGPESPKSPDRADALALAWWTPKEAVFFDFEIKRPKTYQRRMLR